jgi:hypothetical protein
MDNHYVPNLTVSSHLLYDMLVLVKKHSEPFKQRVDKRLFQVYLQSAVVPPDVNHPVNHPLTDPTQQIGPGVCKALRDHGVTAPIDVHLMVDPVDRIIGDFIDAGKRYHIIVMKHQQKGRRHLNILKHTTAQSSGIRQGVLLALVITVGSPHSAKLAASVQALPTSPSTRRLPSTLTAPSPSSALAAASLALCSTLPL